MAWTTNVSSMIFHHWLDLWDLRNGERHGKKLAERSKLEKQQAVREVDLLYEYKDYIKPEHEFIFRRTVDWMRRKQAAYLWAWIADYQVIIERDYNEALNTG